MLRVHVLSHKDGDFIEIVSVPWWMPIYEFIFERLLCPCCGVTGRLSDFEWIGTKIYALSNRTTRVILERAKPLYTVPIKDSCEASSKIWPKNQLCWSEYCEYHISPDAYMEVRRHEVVNWMVQFADWCKLSCLKLIRRSRGMLSFYKTHR